MSRSPRGGLRRALRPSDGSEVGQDEKATAWSSSVNVRRDTTQEVAALTR